MEKLRTLVMDKCSYVIKVYDTSAASKNGYRTCLMVIPSPLTVINPLFIQYFCT